VGNGDCFPVPVPVYPSGEEFSPFTSPWGKKILYLYPLMEEFTVGNRVPIAISSHDGGRGKKRGDTDLWVPRKWKGMELLNLLQELSP
jgi:hypothetical protein